MATCSAGSPLGVHYEEPPPESGVRWKLPADVLRVMSPLDPWGRVVLEPGFELERLRHGTVLSYFLLAEPSATEAELTSCFRSMQARQPAVLSHQGNDLDLDALPGLLQVEVSGLDEYSSSDEDDDDDDQQEAIKDNGESGAGPSQGSSDRELERVRVLGGSRARNESLSSLFRKGGTGTRKASQHRASETSISQDLEAQRPGTVLPFSQAPAGDMPTRQEGVAGQVDGACAALGSPEAAVSALNEPQLPKKQQSVRLPKRF